MILLRLLFPTGLTFVIQDNSILLDWDDSIDTSSGIKEYYIRYSKSYASDVQMPQTETVTASEFEIDGLDNAIYSWSVKAVDYAGNESDWSETEVYYHDTEVPDAPVGLTGVVTDNDVALDWDDSFDYVSGIKEYIVVYSANTDMTDATEITVAASELGLTDMADGTWYWRVKAVDNADNESVWSTTDSFDVLSPNVVKLTASDGAAGDRYGESLDMDGDTVVVTAFYSDSPAVDSGSIYVYKWNGTSYDETELVASDGVTTDFMGSDVAISGSTIVVGAYGDDASGADAGSMYIYKWNGTDYDETKIIASDGGDGVGQDFFGISVAIDGDTIVTGSMWDDDNGESSGSAYVYKWNGTSYGEIKLTRIRWCGG